MKQSTIFTTVADTDIIVNIQYSEIGFGYPRLFIKLKDKSYINVDLTIGSGFKMSQRDWNSWFDDDMVVEADAHTVLSKINMTYAQIHELIMALNNTIN